MPCTALMRIAYEHPETRPLLMPWIKGAAKPWSSLPKGWTEESLKKFWDSMTSEVKHKVTKCMKEMEGKVDNTGAFCGSLADKVDPGWRSRQATRDKKAVQRAFIKRLVRLSVIITNVQKDSQGRYLVKGTVSLNLGNPSLIFFGALVSVTPSEQYLVDSLSLRDGSTLLKGPSSLVTLVSGVLEEALNSGSIIL
jgi:hypothetical protein